MKTSYSRSFKKMWVKQTTPTQKKFKERLDLLFQNFSHPLLRKHKLSGEWSECSSINITGDIRAIFENITETHIEFIAIGTHSELYE